ncbi:MAG: hypothetical protein INR69_04035 [Mucilaginibacter polytrichastri]|nr:hypothetical protein [Mucilaginibacter polytrichastri]
MQFAQIAGQSAVKEHLVQSVKNGRIPHAQLFLGAEGSGSLPLAVAYAQFISCENKGENDSCGVCASCRKYEKFAHPDLHFSYPFFAKDKSDTALTFVAEWRELFLEKPYFSFEDWRGRFDATNKQANINIAECHQIIKKLSLKPFESAYKVLILWLPEYLDKEGNTLLKIIEEPSPNTLFILVAENQDEILSTILSRTQLVKIPRLAQQEVSGWLVKEKNLDAVQADSVAYLAEGSLSRALELSAHTENAFHTLFVDWMRGCYANKMAEVFPIVDKLADAGRETQKNFLQYGISLMREVMIMQSGAGAMIRLPEAEMTFVKRFSPHIFLAQSEAVAAEFEKACFHLERNVNQKILFLDVSLQLVKILKYQSIPSGTPYIIV